MYRKPYAIPSGACCPKNSVGPTPSYLSIIVCIPHTTNHISMPLLQLPIYTAKSL